METKQQSQATTIENLKSETGWEFTVLLIKKKSVFLDFDPLPPFLLLNKMSAQNGF